MSIVRPPRPRTVKGGQASPVHMALARAQHLLSAYNYRYGSEVQLHERLEQVLAAAGVEFRREFILDKQNRADFFLPAADSERGIVIEVKVDGSAAEALRQVDRYIQLDRVAGVLLASTKLWAASELPSRPEWSGKPFGLVRLQRQAL